MDDKWICIRERELLCTEFIDILDRYRYCATLRMRGEKTCERYNRMICVLQEITNDYLNDRNYIEDDLAHFFERNYMELPLDRKLPTALEKLFCQLESKLNVDFTEMLDQCVIYTTRAYSHMKEAQTKEEKRIQLINSLMEEIEFSKISDEEVENRIKKLLLLQKVKMKTDLYQLDEKEINITKVLCDLLISSVFSEVISYGLMLRLVENKVLTESEITEMLKEQYDIEKDYEWYSEDFIGCGLEEPTDIKIEDVLGLCEERISKIIGARI